MTLRIPGYKLKREVGSGGMAAVYLAIQESLDRQVALKVMSPALVADRSFTKRFLREAKTVAALNHPNVVSIFEVGVTDQQLHYFSMEYLPGGDFCERIRRGVSEAELINVLTSIARALGYAHKRGFVHRDVKPGNILFDASGHPVLTDFGIARAASASTRVTGTGVSVGTSHYMSPEQARGKDVDGRTDLYSLGVVAFEALTGRTPYDGEDGFAIAYSHVFDPIPGLPDPVVRWQPFIDRALSKDREDRFASAEELIEALSQFRAGEEVVTTQPGVKRDDPTTPLPIISGRSRRPALVRAMGVAGAVVRGVPGSRRHRMVETAAAGAERLRDIWQGIVHRAFFFLPPPFRALAATLVVVLLASVLAVTGVDWAQIRLPATIPQETAAEPRQQTVDVDAVVDGQRQLATDGFESEAEIAAPAEEPLTGQQAVADPLSGEQREQIQMLLDAAREDLQADRLTIPPEDNAFDRYLSVLQIDPGHEAAIKGIEDIVLRYVVMARERASQGNFTSAVEFLARAQSVAQQIDEDSEALIVLGQAQERLLEQARQASRDAVQRKDFAQAVAHIEAALRLAPDDEALLQALAEMQKQPPITRRFRDSLSRGTPGPEMVVVELKPYTLAMPEGNVLVDDRRTIAVSATEVTAEEFAAFIEATAYYSRNRRSPCREQESRWQSSRERTWSSPGFPQNSDHPVVCVDWRAANAYANWLSSETGASYRLLTETEWEYLAGASYANDADICEQENIADLYLKLSDPGRQVLQCEDKWTYTSPVGAKPANALGVKGIIGNVREWTSDCWVDQRIDASASYTPRLQGDCDRRVVKGLSWLQADGVDNPAMRQGFGVNEAYNTVGFRLVRSID